MNNIMNDEWKEFFINSLISCSDEGIKKPDRNHLYYKRSLWKEIKNFFMGLFHKRDKNKIYAVNGKLYGKDAERYIPLNDFLNCKGLCYEIFIEKWKQKFQYDLLEVNPDINPFLSIYLSHLSMQAGIIIFECFVCEHDRIGDKIPQEYLLNLSMDLLKLVSIFMTPSERILSYKVLKELHPNLIVNIDDITNAL